LNLKRFKIFILPSHRTGFIVKIKILISTGLQNH